MVLHTSDKGKSRGTPVQPTPPPTCHRLPALVLIRSFFGLCIDWLQCTPCSRRGNVLSILNLQLCASLPFIMVLPTKPMLQFHFADHFRG